MRATNNQELAIFSQTACDETETLLFSNHSANLIEEWLEETEDESYASKEKHNDTFKSGRFNN